jgi:hypothetical protein
VGATELTDIYTGPPIPSPAAVSPAGITILQTGASIYPGAPVFRSGASINPELAAVRSRAVVPQFEYQKLDGAALPKRGVSVVMLIDKHTPWSQS